MVVPDNLDLYERLVAGFPQVARKGKTMPYTSVNGNMFSFLTPQGTLALRLPPAARTTFIEAFNTALVEQHGAVMKEYVAVPDSLLADTARLTPYFEQSLEYAASLKPKPSKKRP